MTTLNNGEQFSQHSAELKKKATDLGHDAKDFGVIGGALAADAAHLAGERASEYYQEGIKRAKIFGGSLEVKIKENPTRALLIAAGTGLLAGVLWRRR